MSKFGDFGDFCRDSNLVVCNLFGNQSTVANHSSCPLMGFHTINGHQLGNLGDILLCAIAVGMTVLLFLLTERRKAAVGRREMELVLFGYAIINICEIFSLGGFLTNTRVVQWFSVIQIGAITATIWVLMLNALIGFQILDDGTPASVGLVLGSALIFFIGTGYIAAATAFGWKSTFPSSPPALHNIALYVLYLLFPLICLVAYYLLEAYIVVRILGERRPLFILTLSALSFAVGQIFNFVVSVHICHGTNNKIDGSMFETLFVMISVCLLWWFWISIVEGEYPESEAATTATDRF